MNEQFVTIARRSAKSTIFNLHSAIRQRIPHVRPAVLSERTRDALDEYRGFRHVVRNVYTFKFDPAKVRRLVTQVPTALGHVRDELLAFADFLEQRVQSAIDGRVAE